MKNSLYSFPKLEQNFSSTFPTIQTQQFPWSESQADDWNLQYFLGIVWRKALVIVRIAGAVMGVVSGTTFTKRPEYEGNFKLLVEPVSDENNTLPNHKLGVTLAY